MNISYYTNAIEMLKNTTKHAATAILLISALGCGRRVSNDTKPEIMRSIQYREDEQDVLYDIDYEDVAPYDRDNECILLSRPQPGLDPNKKIVPDTLSLKKK